MRVPTLITSAVLAVAAAASAEEEFQEVSRFAAPEAKQAVAVDSSHFYAIGNSVIGKYEKQTGRRVATWQSNDDLPLAHLNSGIVRDGKLYCAHSNYPTYPETSSVEIWDTKTLRHVGSHSFGIYEGSLTWVDWRDDSWWAVFAHYSKKTSDNARRKTHHWTTLVRFDSKWRRMSGWTFPKTVLDRFAPSSCSGGFWGTGEAIYCTGHDRGEIYRLKLPRSGSTLTLDAVIGAPITGQGIAWDSQSKRLFGINRRQRQVVVSRLVEVE